MSTTLTARPAFDDSVGPDVTYDRIMQTAMGFWASKVLLSAVELNVFGVLASGSLGARSRSSSNGELTIGVWPPRWHLVTGLVLVALSLMTAYWLLPGEMAAWPLLDSLTTWFSLLATWLAARARLENWLYWIVINGVMVFLFYAQQVWGMAVLSVLLMGIAVSGYIAWRRQYRAQAVPACSTANS